MTHKSSNWHSNRDFDISIDRAHRKHLGTISDIHHPKTKSNEKLWTYQLVTVINSGAKKKDKSTGTCFTKLLCESSRIHRDPENQAETLTEISQNPAKYILTPGTDKPFILVEKAIARILQTYDELLISVSVLR